MRFIAALILACALAAAGYALFWWVSLSFSASQMQGAVEQALGGTLTYGKPQWIPDMRAVRVRWPQVRLQLHEGPVREVMVDEVTMVGSFLARDRWRLLLPSEVRLKGSRGGLTLKTKDGELTWVESEGRLVFAAAQMDLLGADGRGVKDLENVIVERRPGDGNVRLNFSTRGMAGGADGVSAQVLVPEGLVLTLLREVGDGGFFLRRMAELTLRQLREKGGTVEMENVSFRNGGADGSVFGTLRVTPDGGFAGQLSVTADNPERLLRWVERAGVVAPRYLPEGMGWRGLRGELDEGDNSVRVEVIPDRLLLSGFPVGPIPNANDVLNRLWPE